MSRPPEIPVSKVFIPGLTLVPGPARADADVEDAYPLSAMQRGMLFNSLLEPGAGVEIEQLVFRLRETLDASGLEAAWREAAERHAILRTSFRWEAVAVPVQQVHARVPLALDVHDWSALAAAEAEARLAEWLRADRARGAAPARAPLQRVALFRHAADDWTLVWTFHHALLDGRAMVLVLADVFAAYEARRDGRDFAPPAPRPYREYIQWLAERDVDASERYWRGLLDGFTSPTPLLPAQPAAADGVVEPVQRSLRLGAEGTAALERLAAEHGLTLNAVVQAAWGVLLARHAGVHDVVFGTTRACRRSAAGGAETVVGPVFNSVPVRLRLDADTSLLACARALRAQSVDVRPHEHTPLQRIQEWCGAAGTPLFDTLVVFEKRVMTETLRGLGGGWHARHVRILRKSNFPATLSAYGGDRLLLTLTCDPSRFDDASMDRLLEHLGAILRAFATDPHQAAQAVDLLDDGERRRLAAWNATATEYPRDATLHGLFAAQAAAVPDAVAVVSGGEALTYAELDARADALALHLARAGVRPGDRVGLALERSLAVPVAILAVLKAGAAYVPLDAAYPPERLAGMIADTAVAVLVVRDALPASLAGFSGRVVSLHAEANAIGACRGEPLPRADVAAESEAYVMFTSGSTGRPKGVAVPHRAVVRLVRGTGFADFGPHQVFLQLAPLAFDASTLEIWGALLNGGRLAVFPPHAPSLDELGAALREHGVTVLWLTAGLFHQMVDLQLESLGGLRQLLAGGDVLSPAHVARVLERFPALRLTNGYGPTENTTFTCCHDIRPEDARRRSIPIGRPIANTRAWVLDAGLRPVPVGVPGELFAAGDGLALGYAGQPALTAERFVDVAVDGRPERAYRTGDRVRWMEDGTLEFLGRLDEQVKIRGFRIEPGEVEAALLALPGVRQAAVLARPDPAGAMRLVAYVVGEGMPAAPREALRGRLPEYMLPAFVVALPALPLTPNGKVDRRALPEPEGAGEAYVAPGTPAEEVLAAVWAEVLGVERVGIHDDFFALGGHSLLAARVAGRVREVMGAGVPLRAVFDAPTVAGLAAAVARATGAARDETPVVPVPREGPLRPSFAQERLWMVQRMEGGATYNIPRAWRLHGPVDAAALDRALTEIVRRHEALRTVFRTETAGDEAVVLPPPDATLAVEDVTGPDAAAREAGAARRVRAEAAHVFDLAAGPLYRFRLLRLDAREHVLLLNFHHVVIDGWSLGVFVRELDALYAAFARGDASPLAEPPVQYADYAAWQRARLAGDPLGGEIAWWTERLAGAPALLELPLDRPRPPVRSQAGALESVALPAGLRQRVEALARAEGASPFMVLLAAWQVLLGTYAGTDDVVVGSPIAGRTRPEVEGLVGFFVNTLALRTDLSGDPAFRQVLRRVRAATLGAYDHQEVPFERLVQALRPERSLGHTPLVQVLFAYGDGLAADAALAGVRASAIEVHTGTAKFDLSLAVAPAGEGLRAELEYATDLFDAATARRMLGHLARLVEQAASHPDRRLSALDLLSPEEHAFLDSVCATPEPPPDARLFPQRFAEQAARTPDALAVIHGSASLTYAELDARANRLAHRLAGLGVGPEVRVGLHLPRTPEMVVALLGVLKAGGAYVPLDARLPADRIAQTLVDCAARVLLCTEADPARIGVPAGCTALCIDTDAETAGQPASAPRVHLHPENLSHVIYTSGSTGRPKGVMIRHGNVASFLSAMHAVRPVEAGERVLGATSLSFDVSVEEVHLSLASGATLVLVENALSLAEGEYGPLAQASMGPSAAAELLRAGALPGGVRRLYLGAEAVPAELVRALFAAGVPEVHNFYGPTEDTTSSTHAVLSADVARMTVGRPLAGKAARVLDAALRPVPVGVYGEVYLAGAGQARGYLGQPGMTADRFVPDPFCTAGGRMYRTGDRARWTADGLLEFQGRTDFQVKVRGFRVEPGEIEAVLRERADVREAVVVARPGAGGSAVLVAYAAPEAGEALDAAALRDHLAARLPAYTVPAAIVALERLPLNANGKVDRRALPDPELSAEADYTAPRTPAEATLAGIWAEMLGVERVGAHDHFFERGGHSLLAMRLVGRIAEVFGAELSMRAVFEAPTVARLAERVHAARGAAASRFAPLVPVARGDDVPLSFAQERMWFLDQLQPGGSFYNVPAAVRLSGALDGAALERALGETVRRHEALRTTFAPRGAGAVQVVAPFAGFTLPVEDLSALDVAERETEAPRRAADEAARPFDLAAGPLFRARLLRLAADEHVLLLTLHHAVSDGWSMDVLYAELGALYGAFVEGRPSPLGALPVQYADYAAWQRRQLADDVLARELAWWTERLAGAPALLELPTDRPRPALQSYRGAREDVALPAELVARLEALARAAGGSLYMVLLGAWQVLLGRYAGTDDVVVGSPIAGRTRPEVEGLIGLFVNTLVLRTDLSGDPAFREVLRRVCDGTLSAFEHQHTPVETVVRAVAPVRSLSHAPLFQVMFVLHPGGVGLQLPGLRAADAGTGLEAAKADLMLALAPEADGGMRGVLSYATDLFDPATIQRMLGHLRRVLEQVAADADVPVSRLDLLTAPERAVVVDAWNRTDAPYPADACIHTLFQAQAVRTPDAPAATHGTETVAYAELNARANRLARHLRTLGVDAETRVGICQARGISMLVSMLAVLKAGGAYVALDPAYPADRLAFILRDAGVAVLLTEAPLGGLLHPPAGVPIVRVDAAAAEIAAHAGGDLDVRVSPRNLGYLIYTSGSTGVPKGVAIEHASAVALLAWAADLHTAEELRGMLACTSTCFDLSVYELFLPLSRGGRVILVDNALALPSAPAAAEVRLLNTVPSAAAALLKTGGIPAGVTTVNLAGEPLPTELVDALYAHGISRVLDLYGPSEDTTYSTWTLRRPGAPATIGRPIANTRALVLDAGMRPVPVGVPGELFLAGRGLARGYLGRPSLTADRFIPDPFGAEPGARLYRTGDRVRWTSAGELAYLGRVDAQVKVRGYRIELGELEAALRTHAGVRECVVTAPEAAPGERRLAAYVAGDADADTLRAHLRRTLPEYMVPAAWVRMDALPLNPNGKLDRKALPAPEWGLAVDEDGFVAPRTEVEAALAEVWGSVLGVERVGVHDGFFELGGHSLLATRLVWRIRETLDGDVDLVSLFENPTIAAMAPRLSLRSGAVSAAAAPVGEQALLDMLDDLSEDELDRLLRADLENTTLS